MGSPIISPDGQEMAYTFIPAENKSNLAFAYLNENRTREYPLAGDILAEMAWQPNGDWLAVNMDIRSDSSGRVTGSNNYLINPLDFSSKQLPSINFLNPNTVWDPTGDRLVWIGTEWLETSYSIHLWIVDAITGQGADLSETLGLEGSDFLFVNNAAWLAQP
jgi:Tol biopolymer transport system component